MQTQSNTKHNILYIFAFFWGCFWAYFLQFTQVGVFLAEKRTWLTVVIGVGFDLLLVGFLMPQKYWLRLNGIIILSSLGIISRSLYNELKETEEFINLIKGNHHA